MQLETSRMAILNEAAKSFSASLRSATDEISDLIKRASANDFVDLIGSLNGHYRYLFFLVSLFLFKELQRSLTLSMSSAISFR